MCTICQPDAFLQLPSTFQSSSVLVTTAANPDYTVFAPIADREEQVGNIDDPFSAHNFDIQIDVPTEPEGTYSGTVHVCDLSACQMDFNTSNILLL